MAALLATALCSACTTDSASRAQEETRSDNDPVAEQPLPEPSTQESADEPVDEPVSGPALDDGHWENSLKAALVVLDNDPSRLVVLEAVLDLTLPDPSVDSEGPVRSVDPPISFVTSDGTPGSVESAACEGGGGFEVTRSADSFGIELIRVEGCKLGPRTIDGRFTREGATDTDFGGTLLLTFEDFSVDDGARRVVLSAGTYRRDHGHPVGVAAWQGASYATRTEAGTTSVTGLDAEDHLISGAAFDRSLSARFSLTTPWAGEAPLSVSTSRDFGGLTTSASGRDFTAGILVLESAEGDRLTLDVDGSDEAGEALITRERSGVVTSVYRSWPLAQR